MISLTTTGHGSCGSVRLDNGSAAVGPATQGLRGELRSSKATSNCGTQRVGVAVGANRARGTDLARRFQRPVEHVGHGHGRRAGEPRRDDGEAANGAAARDEHALAEQVAGAVNRVQPDRKRLGERQLSQAHVAGHRIALPLAQDEILENMPCTCG